jgi:hypothetical protein
MTQQGVLGAVGEREELENRRAVLAFYAIDLERHLREKHGCDHDFRALSSVRGTSADVQGQMITATKPDTTVADGPPDRTALSSPDARLSVNEGGVAPVEPQEPR